MAAEGGAPKRLTWHPDADAVVGWTPDGKKIVYKSGGESYADFTKLYLVAAEGGVPEALPMWRAGGGWYLPGASPLAYVANSKWQGGGERDTGGGRDAAFFFLLGGMRLCESSRGKL